MFSEPLGNQITDCDHGVTAGCEEPITTLSDQNDLIRLAYDYLKFIANTIYCFCALKSVKRL
jgi:hypothetical protein